MFHFSPLFMFRRYLFLGLRSKPAPLADDERPIPSGARMCGEFINPLHYYCNLQQFLVSSMVGGDANGPYFRWSGPATTTVGVNFARSVATQRL